MKGRGEREVARYTLNCLTDRERLRNGAFTSFLLVKFLCERTIGNLATTLGPVGVASSDISMITEV